MPTIVEEATQTLNELLRMHQLNQELLYALTDAIAWIRIYSEKHKIPLSNLSTYNSLLEKANALISEIVNDSPPFLQHRKRTPTNKTEPPDQCTNEEQASRQQRTQNLAHEFPIQPQTEDISRIPD